MTLTEIGKLCGVSRPIVSAIINKKQGNVRYSNETCEKVMKVVNEVNYRPNRTSINLKSQKHNSIGVLIKNIHSIPYEAMSSIIQNTSEKNQTLVIDTLKEGNSSRFITEDIVDGILTFDDLGDELDNLINKYNIPTVYVNTNKCNYKSLTVNVDEEWRMNKVANLFKCNNKKYPLLILQGNLTYDLPRQEYLQKACFSQGLCEPVFLNAPENIKRGKNYRREYIQYTCELIKETLLSNTQIDSIITEYHNTSIATYDACRKINKVIPKDIGVISLNDPHKLWRVFPYITSVYVGYAEIATTGINLLNKAISKEKCSDIKYKCAIEKGGSV